MVFSVLFYFQFIQKKVYGGVPKKTSHSNSRLSHGSNLLLSSAQNFSQNDSEQNLLRVPTSMQDLKLLIDREE